MLLTGWAVGVFVSGLVLRNGLGAESIEDLLQSVPKSVRLNRPLNLPPGASELELRRILGRMAAKNSDLDRTPGFLGAGIYDHYIPAVVPQVMRAVPALLLLPWRRIEFCSETWPFGAALGLSTTLASIG